ncbi:MAG: NrpR regulatory domain-containing protein [Phycisphaerae bacterium]
MHADHGHTIAAILRILDEAGRPLGSTKIARSLRVVGIDLAERMVRNYLAETDRLGLTVNLGRRGRALTDAGRQELAATGAARKIGFIDARGEELAYRMTFDLRRSRGTVIVNLSAVARASLDEARRAMQAVVRAGLGMGRIGRVDGDAPGAAGLPAGEGEAVISTVCSLTLNGLLAAAGVPTVSRFGGLLEVHGGAPRRFTHIIEYAGTTLDPIEIFIKARMTSVGEAARTGRGVIGASFREVPAVALPKVRKVVERMEAVGLGGLVVVGEPSRPLAEIPVGQGRAGLIIAAGLNPVAAVHEAGIRTENRAMARLCEFGELESLV